MILTVLFLSGLTLFLNADTVSGAVPLIRFFCIHSNDLTYKETSINDITKNLDLTKGFGFYVHGWQSDFSYDKKDSIPYRIGLEWVKAKKINFCGVDWRELANDGYYDASQKHVQYIGNQLALFLAKLNELKVSMDSVSIAGHSLGAHVAGFADNAKFVQVLHTAMGSFGTSDMLGHADFIVNGGKIQNACLDDVATAQNLLLVCSHSLANPIFFFSFAHSCTGATQTKPDGVLAKIFNFFSKNSGTDLYGIHNKGKSGVFELKTSNSEPYCENV